MIYTDKYRMYGQLEDQAETGDIEAFVFQNGEVIPAAQADTSNAPVIHTAPERNYGQLEDIANENKDVEEYVFDGGKIVPATQAGSAEHPVIHTAPEKNYAI